MTKYHLAQFNIARARTPMGDPAMTDFVAQLDAINALADGSPGFVWRLQDDSGNATAIQGFEDPNVLLNLSVWETAEDLFTYVYKSGHAKVMARRRDWFERGDGPPLVLWWVPAGHIPDLNEAKARLDELRRNGPGPTAFSFKERFPAPEEAA
jgi:hypothetical protein